MGYEYHPVFYGAQVSHYTSDVRLDLDYFCFVLFLHKSVASIAWEVQVINPTEVQWKISCVPPVFPVYPNTKVKDWSIRPATFEKWTSDANSFGLFCLFALYMMSIVSKA